MAGDHAAETVSARLDAARVVIRSTRSSAPLALAIANLVARLAPRVDVECTDPDPVEVPVFGVGTVAAIGRSVVQQVRLSTPRAPQQTLVINVGTPDPDADLYVSSSGWSLTISDDPHDPLTGNGPALVAASALVSAEAMRRLLPELPGRRLSGEAISWNLLDYRTRVAASDPSVGRVEGVCFGGGSVGSSLVYALLLGHASGRLVVVDPDKLMPHNRIRYPLWLTGPTQVKARWLEDAARGSNLQLIGRSESATAFIARHPEPIALAIAAVDTVSARRDIADALANHALNAGVAVLQLHVSRHRFNDGAACLYCGYVDVGDALDESGVYAEMTGLDPERVRALLGGELVQRLDVESMMRAGKLSSAPLDLVGARLQDVVHARLYAEVEARTEEGTIAVAAPYVSALAGAILAAEVQKQDLEQYWLDRRVDVDCSGYPSGLQTHPAQDRTGRCLCSDPFRRTAYSAMWD